MILTEKSGNVTVSNDVVPSQFRIRASKKAFEILSSGLYSDKIRATIRELCTNAADAHVAAGKGDVPFKVHLPNNLEPWFSVTDYGVGLSDNAMQTVYTTYFESDKTDSNEYTGCLGLGSKSPFSYTDSFTVESRYNGVKSIYTAFLSEEGMPTIAKLSSESTDESNGLTVSFPVNSGDFNSFRDKAVNTLRWFKTRPLISGSHNVTFPEREYLMQTEKFAVAREREGRSYCVMGNVAYQIEASEFIHTWGGEDQKLRNLTEWGVELYVGIGDVDIAASREKLGYDKRTIAFLKNRLREALVDLEKHVTEDIKNKPTLWEARRALHGVRTSFQGFDFKAEWNGMSILDYVKVTRKEVPVIGGANDGATMSVPVAMAERIKIKSYRNDGIVVKKDRADTLYADDTPIFLNDDRGSYAAVRRYLENNTNLRNGVYLLSDYDEQWLKESGISDVAKKTSSLPKAIRTATTRGASQKAKLYEYVSDGSYKSGGTAASHYWKPAEVDLDEGGIYVEILYFNFRMKEGMATQSPHELRRPLSILEKVGRETKVYGIRPSDKAMLDKSEGEWRSLGEYMVEVEKELETTYYPDLVRAEELEELCGSYYRTQYIPYHSFNKCKFQQGSLFGQFVTEVQEASKSHNDKEVKAYNELRRWVSTSGDTLKEGDTKDRLVLLRDELWKTYPMLRYIDQHNGSEDFIKDAMVYIEQIDNENLVSVKAKEVA